MQKKNEETDFLKKWNPVKDKIYRARIAQIALSTLCFFTEDKRGESKPVGSGILLKIGAGYYIVSAAHVLAEFLDSTYILMGENAITVGGISISSPMPVTGSRADDKIDLTVIKLDDAGVSHLLEGYIPVTEREILMDHEIEHSPGYFFYGYPLTRTGKVWGKDEIRAEGFAYQAQPLKGFAFERFGFSAETHFALGYDGGVTSSLNPREHLSPDLTGISGSGLWYFSGRDQKGLIGIAIERIDKVGQKALIATHIKEVMKIIERF